MSKLYELTFRLGAQLAGNFQSVFASAQTVLGQLNDKVSKLGAQQQAVARMIQLKESVAANTATLAQAQAKVAQFDAALAAGAGPLAKLRGEYKQAQGDVLRLANQMAQSKNPSVQLRAEYDAAKIKLANLGVELKGAERDHAKLGAQMTAAKAKVTTTNSTLEKQNAELAKLSGNLKLADTSTAGLTAQQVKLEAAAKKAAATQKALQANQAAIQANQNNRAKYQSQFLSAAAMASAIDVPVMKAVGNWQAFEKESQMIGNTAAMTKGQIASMNAMFMQTGTATNQMAGEIQKGAGILVAAGLDINKMGEMTLKNAGVNNASAEQIQKAGEESFKTLMTTIGSVSTASGTSVEDLSQTVFTLYDALKVPPTQMIKALDVLAQAGKDGQFELDKMAAQIPVLSASFVALKMSGTEAAATMGAALQIARKGAGSPEEAANNMKNYLQNIMSPRTRKRFEDNFDIDIVSIIKNAQTKGQNPFEASIKTIIAATKGDAKLIGDLFQDAQVQQFIRPMIQYWKEYGEIKKDALGTKDVNLNDFNTNMQLGAEKTKALAIEADLLQKNLGQALSPAISGIASALAPVVAWLSRMTAEHPKLIAGVVGVTAALVAAVAAFAAIGFVSTYVIGGFLQVRKAILLTRIAMLALNFTFLTNPVFLVIAGIVALGGALVLAYNKVDWFRKAVDTAWTWITSINWGAVGMAIVNGFKWAFMNLTPMGWLIQAFTAAYGYLSTVNWSAVGAAIVNSLKWGFMNLTIIGWLIQAFTAAYNYLTSINWYESGVAIMRTLGDGVMSGANNLLNSVKSTFAKVRDYLPFSDAKIGPLSDLTLSGQRIMSTLGEGMAGANLGQITAPLGGLAEAAGGLGVGSAVGGVGVGAGGITINQTITIGGAPGADVRQQVRDGARAGAGDLISQITAAIKGERRVSYA